MNNTIFDKICEWCFDVMGWKIVGDIPYHFKQLLVIAAPHTSGWEILYGIGARRKIALPVHFIAKKELFDNPFSGYLFSKLGGSPVDRSGNKNTVDEVLKHFDANERFYLSIAPEGTRAKVDKFKSGFYHIAKKGKLPLLMLGIDFARREFVFRPVYFIKGDKPDEEIAYIQQWFTQFKGYHPEKGVSPIIADRK